MKKTLNTSLGRIAAALIAVIMLLTTFSLSAFAASAPTPAAGNVVINGATAGDKFSAYKVIVITYNNTTNTLSYEWTDEVKAALNAKSITVPTVEAFAALDKDNRQEFLAKIADILVNGSTSPSISPVTPVKTDVTVTAGGKATFDSLAWGEYLIAPTLTTSVYEIMLGAIKPVGDGTNWTVTQGEELTVKKTDGPTVTKTTPDDNVGLWTTIPYTIEFSVPKYDGTCVDKKFSINDIASSGLTYKENLKVYGVVGATDTELTINDVTLSKTIPAADAAGFTLMLDFDYDDISTYDSIKVTYDAQINDAAVLKDANTNTATLTYSNYPYVEGSHKEVTSTEEVFTYGIKVFKYDGNSTAKNTYDEVIADGTTKALPDAEFDVYRPVEGTETGVSVTGIAGKVVKIGTITSDDTGYASIKDLKAGTYYLVETQAPSGYNLLANPVTVTFDKDQTDAQGYFDTLVANNSGFNLPQTGGIGTLIFTVSGIVLMAGAVILLVVLKKKKTKSAE